MLCLLSSGYSQGNGGRPPGRPPWGNPPGPPPGKGPRSDNKTPHAYGMNKSKEACAVTMLTPTGWGSSQKFVFITVGGTPNQMYSEKPDMAMRTGVGFGDSRKLVSVVGMLNINDVSRIRNLSYSFIASRSLNKWGSISVGALHLLKDKVTSDGIASYYVAYSNAFRGLKQVTPDNPRLSFTVGAGTGHFHTMSPSDYENGKGRYGTGVFANISYDVVKNLSLSAEWTGTNLGISTAYRLPRNLPIVFLGVSDLTQYSGDAPMFVFGVGKALGFNGK